jgi:DNA-binding NarL/FixJ family response regulator
MKFLIADDHPLVRRALSLTLERVCPGSTVLDADTLESAFSIAAEHPDLDLFLMDLFMPGTGGLEGLKLAKNRLPFIPIAIVSADESSSSALGALELGAAGYLPKSLPEEIMRAALSLILAGGIYVPPMIAEQALSSSAGTPYPYASPSSYISPPHAAAKQPLRSATLTPRQSEVLDLVIEGLANKEIADRLSLAEATVKVHITAILRAYGVSNRTKAISAARREREGLINS